MATPEGLEPSTTRLEGCSEANSFNAVSHITRPKEDAESLEFYAGVKLSALLSAEGKL